MNQDPIEILLFILYLIVVLLAIRHNLRVKKVEKEGYYYNKIIPLNKKFNVGFFYTQLKFHKNYNSKASLDRAQLRDAAIQYVSENLQYVENQIQTYKRFEKHYNEYYKNVNAILETKHDYSDLKINILLFKSLADFKDIENKKVQYNILKNQNKLSLYVSMDYLSPQGRNHWSKDFEYNLSEILEFVEIVKHHKEYTKSIKYQRTILSDSLRYDILKRDNFTCRLCGASSKKDGVKLEVDHIFPVSKGGKTEPQNLQTLCERCNRGKSDKI